MVAPLVNAVSVSKFVVLAPFAYLTILVTVAPASVLVKVVAAIPVACAVVSVIAPGVSEPRVALEIPRVELRPLIEALDKVATFELTVTSTR